MSQRKQLTWTELRVGLFVLVGMVVLAVGILYVTGTGILAAKYRLRTYLPEVEGLKIGAPVRLDGVEIGNVDAIRMNPKTGGDRAKNIELVLRIDKKYQNEVRGDSSASLITEGLLGNRYVSIKRGFVGTPLQADAELQGKEEQAIKNIVERGAELVQNLNTLSAQFGEIVDAVKKGRGSLGKILVDETAYNHLNAALTRLDQMSADTQAGRNSLGKLVTSEELYQKVHSAASRLDSLVADVQAQKGSLGKFVYDPTLYNDAKSFVQRGNTVLTDVQAGKGTLGRLYVDDSLYNKWRDAGANVDAAAAKLNSTTGSAGKLFTDPQLYDNITALSGDMRLLVGDFRKNPKKFLHVKFSMF